MDDFSDDQISFDSSGFCNYCENALKEKPLVYFPNEEGTKRIGNMLSIIRNESRRNPFNCIMGLSGGLDSSYLAYLGAVKWGLKIFAIHIDDGFDEPVAKRNIEKLCENAGIELLYEKPDFDQYCDLTRSFLFAGVPNIAIPQDNILAGCLYKQAKNRGIKHFLSGGNFALECILQKGNTHDALDKKHIIRIHDLFGKDKIDHLPIFSHEQYLINRFISQITTWRPLNYIDYRKSEAIESLKDFCGFEYYGSKHLENKFTKFLQLYWLPKKFNVDKRKSHLSSMIISDQLTREEALKELKKPLYDEFQMTEEVLFVMEKLGISKQKLAEIMNNPVFRHNDYPFSTFGKFYRFVSKALRKLKKRVIE